MEAHSIYANFSLDRFSVLLLIGFRCLDFTFALHQLRPAAAFMECVDFTLLKPRCAIVLDKQTAGLIMESRYATFTTALLGGHPPSSICSGGSYFAVQFSRRGVPEAD